MLKTFTKVATRCPVVFKDEIKSVFNSKESKFDTEIDKTPKIFNFQRFYAVFPEFSTNSGNWNIGLSPQGVNWISSVLSEEINAFL